MVRIDRVPIPKTCPHCGGTVIYTSNSKIYGKEYGSGRCYMCTNCDSYVGTHPKPNQKEPLGYLSNKEMRELKKKAHSLFDPLWRGKNKKMTRSEAYDWLAKSMDIEKEDCHFGHFWVPELKKAIQILENEYSNQTS